MNQKPQPQSAIVIGAGVAGLATAGLLAKRGIDVTVVEKNDTVGGRAGEITVDGFRFETGPSLYLMPDAFDHFYRLMGTSTEDELDLTVLDPGYRVFPEGSAPLDVPYGEDAACALFEAIEPGAGEKLREYLATASLAYRVALERFLYTTFSAVGPLVHKDVLTNAVDLAKWLLTPLGSYVDKRFTDVRLRQILSYPAVFLSSRPEQIPSLYHLMSHTDITQGVRYPIGGFSSIIASLERLAHANGARFELGTEVVAVTTDNAAATDFVTGVRVRRADGQITEYRADIVVSGADLHHTENSLLPAHLRSYPERYFAHRNPGIGAVLAMVGVRGQLPELQHHNLFFSSEWSDDFDVVFDGPQASRPEGASRSVYVCAPSKSEPGLAPDGHENLFILVPCAADTAIGHGDAYRQPSGRVNAIADAAITQVGQWAGIEDLAERIVVRRTIGPADFAERYHSWSGLALGPAHTLRQSAFLRGRNVSGKVSGLYYAGSTTVPGVGVPMCLISAENVLKRIDGDTSPGPTSG